MELKDTLTNIMAGIIKLGNSEEDTPANPEIICEVVEEQETEEQPIPTSPIEECTSEQVEENKLEEDVVDTLPTDEFSTESGLTDSQPIEQTSLLDNADYMALAQQCCDMIGELDRIYNQVSDELLKNFILQQKSHIREALVLSGATLIDEETEFNILRHQLVNGGIVKNGTPISEILEAGVEISGRVMVKAKVKD